MAESAEGDSGSHRKERELATESDACLLLHVGVLPQCLLRVESAATAPVAIEVPLNRRQKGRSLSNLHSQCLAKDNNSFLPVSLRHIASVVITKQAIELL